MLSVFPTAPSWCLVDQALFGIVRSALEQQEGIPQTEPSWLRTAAAMLRSSDAAWSRAGHRGNHNGCRAATSSTWASGNSSSWHFSLFWEAYRLRCGSHIVSSELNSARSARRKLPAVGRYWGPSGTRSRRGMSRNLLN